MENFFHNDRFYTDLDELLQDLDYEEYTDIPDDFCIEIELAKKEPVINLNADWICERISGERLSEEGDELEKIHDLLEKYLDFEKLKGLIPELWYTTRKKVKLTKKDFIDL